MKKTIEMLVQIRDELTTSGLHGRADQILTVLKRLEGVTAAIANAPVESDLWKEFSTPPKMSGGMLTGGFCGLCGNTGIIDTIGKVFSPAGYHAGVQAYCICPNGRAWKEAKADLKALCARAQKGEA